VPVRAVRHLIVKRTPTYSSNYVGGNTNASLLFAIGDRVVKTKFRLACNMITGFVSSVGQSIE
jgi:hypothetical protein